MDKKRVVGRAVRESATGLETERPEEIEDLELIPSPIEGLGGVHIRRPRPLTKEAVETWKAAELKGPGDTHRRVEVSSCTRSMKKALATHRQ